MDNKVNFLRGTSAEYESSIKDNDTFYYTTDDEKLYLGDKEITGGGVTIDDTLSDTSKNPVQNKVINAALNSKANLSDIPTSLPADGGNADTLDGKHASDFVQKSGGSMSGNLRMETNRLWFGTGGISQFYFENTDGVLNLKNHDGATIFTANYVGSYATNADTVDGKHASDFALKTDIPTTLPANGGNADTANGLVYHELGLGTNYTMTASDFSKPGIYGIGSLASGSPNVLDEDGFNVGDFKVLALNNNPTYQMVIMTSPRYTDNRAYIGRFWDGNFIGWKRISDGGNAATVGNKSIEDLMSYGMAFGDRTSEPHQITSGDLNNYHTAGCFLVPNAKSAQAITNSPFTNSGYFLDIYSRNSSLTLQIAFIWGWGKNFDKSVIKIRSSTASSWSEWKTINTEIAGDLASTPTNACLRNIYAGTSDMTAGTTALETGAIYLVYE